MKRTVYVLKHEASSLHETIVTGITSCLFLRGFTYIVWHDVSLQSISLLCIIAFNLHKEPGLFLYLSIYTLLVAVILCN